MIVYAAAGDTWGIGGPTFLRGYLTAAAIVLIGTLVHRRRLLRGQALTPTDPRPQAAAYLNGGAKLAVYASLGGLRTAGAIAVSVGRLRQAGSLPAGATPLDQAVYHAAGQRLRPRELIRHDQVTAAVHRLRSEVERSGLVVTAEQRRAARIGPLILLGLVVLGVARLIAGTANDRPVGYLILALLVLVPTTALLLRAPRRTRTGNDVLARMRAANAHLAPSQRPSWRTYGPSGAALGVALYGGAALWAADPVFASAADVQRRFAASGYPGSSGSGGSGGATTTCGGGGGSCGGGGGCGGGGCGG